MVKNNQQTIKGRVIESFWLVVGFAIFVLVLYLSGLILGFDKSKSSTDTEYRQDSQCTWGVDCW
jgi:hypothetical protein